ncbi:hypothetical protein [Roseibacillus ishigakijimensis]|uniref:Uncharacterized protein n=1 Tax=Roseibacillus ishigakijimensis TaxID=454146 RepID=A0A934VNV5_9BACT|nr:hypothetical protein [Roseibacillus ishigakijimensis]MBK1835456.1 hypothetical protein [Roseibacillus ishigakijimensis]
MKFLGKWLILGLLASGSVWGEEVKSQIAAEVKAATLIDGQSGIHTWAVTGEVTGSESWTSMRSVVMMAKPMFMVALGMEYSKEGGEPAVVLGPGLAEETTFTKVESAADSPIYTFEQGGQPAAVRVFDKQFYLTATVERPGKMEAEQALKEMVALLKGVSIAKE